MARYNWEEIIKDYQNSGMSKPSYCLKHNISDTTLTRNMARLHIKDTEAAAQGSKQATKTKKNASPTPVFIPLELEPVVGNEPVLNQPTQSEVLPEAADTDNNKAVASISSFITISYKDFKIDVSEATDVKVLKSVLKVLQSC